MELLMYSEEYENLLQDYYLTEEQLKFVKSPEENMALAYNDKERYPVLMINEGEITGFFVLHFNSEMHHHFDVEDSVYIRSFSVDDHHTGKGYARQALERLPAFVRAHFPEVGYLLLLVDFPNERAKKMYEKNGFIEGKVVPGERYDAYTMTKAI